MVQCAKLWGRRAANAEDEGWRGFMMEPKGYPNTCEHQSFEGSGGGSKVAQSTKTNVNLCVITVT